MRDILQSYVKDFREDRFASDPMLFGITVPGEGAWHVRVTGERDELDRADKPRWGVTLHDGPAPEPTLLYRIEAATLRAIDRGEINALTAQAKMFATDFAPMDAIEMPGYEPTAEEDAKVNPFSFHFWTRGFPEVIPFGDGMTRVAHGADVAVFYYQEGIRTTWLRMKPGVRVRDDAREQAAPFPMLGVTIKGTSRGIVDGAPITLQAGNTVFIPANVMHKWWNEGDEDAEVILIMFGEGA
ncbi:MAG: cupin domain-containing protein [Phycisphaerales bacterium]|nr:cupin domain-containing protein [Phycisphaerales bacterium]